MMNRYVFEIIAESVEEVVDALSYLVEQVKFGNPEILAQLHQEVDPRQRFAHEIQQLIEEGLVEERFDLLRGTTYDLTDLGRQAQNWRLN